MSTPGTYLRDCRESAGVSAADVVTLMEVLRLRSLAGSFPQLIERIEANQMRANDAELMALRLAFDFRPATYRRLCAEADAAQQPQQERTAHHG